MKHPIAIIISGRGSNMEALISAANSPIFPAQVALVISNKAEAKGLETAKNAGINTLVVDYSAGKEAAEYCITTACEEAGIELICLAGFMRVLSSDFVQKWQGKLINIHPSLLPKFPGLHIHERVIEAGEKESGCTVHYVDSGVDTGEIIMQSSVPVMPNDTPDTLAARVLEQEHRIYPAAVSKLLESN